MGIISIDSTAVMTYNCTAAVASGNERAKKVTVKSTTPTSFSPKSTTTINNNTSYRTMRRPRSDSNSSCDSSVFKHQNTY